MQDRLETSLMKAGSHPAKRLDVLMTSFLQFGRVTHNPAVGKNSDGYAVVSYSCATPVLSCNLAPSQFYNMLKRSSQERL